jgi:hypothetical protein
MLVKKEFQKDDVIDIKMANGDEVISTFINETRDEITIKNPMVLTMGPNGALGMIPWIFLSEQKEHTLRKSQTFVVSKTRKDSCDQYLKLIQSMEEVSEEN